MKIPSRKKFKWYFTIAYSADYTLINKNNEKNDIHREMEEQKWIDSGQFFRNTKKKIMTEWTRRGKSI